MLAILFGIITGAALGLTGGGGSIFAVPLLFYGLGLPIAHAVAASSFAVGVTAGIGGVRGLRTRVACLRTGLIFAVSGIVGAPAGVHLGRQIADTSRLEAFGVLLIGIGIYMWIKTFTAQVEEVRASLLRGDACADGSAACRYADDGKLRLTTPCALILMVSGLLTGVLSGLFGVGGGFLIVPVLRTVTGLSMHRAIATSLLIIALISSSAVISFLAIGGDIKLAPTLLFVFGGALGLLGGAAVCDRLAGRTLQRTFATLIVLVGIGILSSLTG